MNVFVLFLLLTFLTAETEGGSPMDERVDIPEDKEVVVLLHGIRRTPRSMEKLERRLAAEGYHTVNFGYSSVDYSIEEIVSKELTPLMRKLDAAGARRVNFVTHSMGGLLVRYFAHRHGKEGIGRVVMLAPPNHGSEVADRIKGLAPYRWIYGPAGEQLGTGAKSLPRRLTGAGFEVGIIAGVRTWNPLFSRWIPGNDDGTVAVESTKLETMNDFREVHAVHGLIMRHSETIDLTVNFLRAGTFASKTKTSTKTES